jgi:two-component system, NtrC family, response regulator GlrR
MHAVSNALRLAPAEPDDDEEIRSVTPSRMRPTAPATPDTREWPATGALRSPPTPSRRFGRLVARSAPMHALFDMLERFARTDVTVTLVGETGSGKDLVAHALHDCSARAAGPMVVFDCGSVAANLAESELLGHERGAFTGAVSTHAGAFERAHGGTLFLDEVAELPLDLQPRLLRALESRRVRRVGGKADRRVDVRVIAATHRDLRAEVAAGRFREDLYFRLAVAVVSVPPLRKRVDELADLVADLIGDLGRPDLRASEATLATLGAHSWPGNVRELRNTLACALALLDYEVKTLDPAHIRLLTATEPKTAAAPIDALPLAGHSLDCIERAAIRQTLRHTAGNKANAARTLGIAISTLYEKLKKFGMEDRKPEPGAP